MKHFGHLLVLSLLLVGALPTRAEIISPYTFGFNNDLKEKYDDMEGNLNIGYGWGHIASSYDLTDWGYAEVYPDYTWYATNGVDGSGCLYVPNQETTGYSYTFDEDYGCGPTTDLIVTPAVKGKTTLQVKDYMGGTVKFYRVTKSGNAYKMGEQLKVTVPALSSSNWATVTITDDSYEGYIGIYGSNVYIDNFTAASADAERETIEEKRSLAMGAATSLSPGKIDCTPSDSAYITVRVTLTNAGTADLAPGDEGYTLSLCSYGKSRAYATTAIDSTLAVGETKTVTATFGLANASSLGAHLSTYLYENVSETYKYLTSYGFTAYKPILKVTGEDGKEVASGTSVNFGALKGSGKRVYAIANEGAAPMDIESISVPEGFKASLTAPMTIAAHAQDSLTITVDPTLYGPHNGDLTIRIANDQADDYTLSLQATVIDPSKCYADFNDQQLPTGWVAQGGWEVHRYMLGGYQYVDCMRQTDSKKAMLITPLLRVGEGESMSFEAGMQGYYPQGRFQCSVYYSKDRQHWTLAKTLTPSDMPDKQINASQSLYELKSFALDNIPAGEWYVGFEAVSANLDNVYGFELAMPAHDWALGNASLPTTAMVNNAYRPTATLRNMNVKAEEAEGYTATLYFDGKAVSQARPQAFATGDSATFAFSYTPHATGDYPAYILFGSDSLWLSTDTVTVSVGEEVAARQAQAGQARTVDESAPLELGYNYSETETIYTADKLYGLKAGDQIKRITYRGYNKNADDYTTQLNVWIANTTDTLDTQNKHSKASVDSIVKQMTVAYDAPYTFRQAGTSNTDLADLLVIDLQEPFVYTGGNLHIVVRAMKDDERNNNSDVCFEADDSDKLHTYIRRTSRAEWFDEERAWLHEMPVARFTLVQEPSVVEGKVLAGGKGLEGARVTMRNGEVIYSTTSDAEGSYRLNVIQSGLNYQLTAATDNPLYQHYEEADSITLEPGATLNHDITLSPVAAYLTGTVTGNQGALAGAVVTLTSGEVAYKATTAADGSYRIEVPQSLLTYQASVTAEGYMDYTEASDVTFTPGEEKRLDFNLVANRIGTADDGRRTGEGYNLQGQRVGQSYRGIVIRGGKKHMKKP